jgi:hypothetical protein
MLQNFGSRLAIIVVNYRTPDLVIDCLKSLKTEISSPMVRVVVVDNDSGDGSVECLLASIEEHGWTRWTIVLPQDRNLGFAAGNNAAIRYLLALKEPPDNLLLLNPDTVIHGGAVEQLSRFLEVRPEVGIVGAQLENEFHVPQSSARRFPSVWSEFDNGARFGVLSRLLKNYRVALPVANHAHRCDWVSGAAMMFRRKVIEQIGLMDEGFFLYFEELDFCQRASNAGWQIWLDPAARVTHLEGGATGIRQARRRRGQYWYDSRRRYFIKHFGIPRWILADLLWGLGRLSLLARTRFNLGGDISGDPLHYFRDLIWGDLCALIKGQARLVKISVNLK